MVLTSKSHRCIGSLEPAVALRAVAGAAIATSMALTYLLYLLRQGGPTRTSADVSVPRFAGFSLIT
jgi:hypothetical protein